MKYKTGAAFRRALEARLLKQSLDTGLPLTWLRKLVAFDRFLARLVKGNAGRWFLKGGLALQLRMGSRARTTKDIDATMMEILEEDEIRSRIQQAASVDLKDWFEFQVQKPSPVATGAPHGGFRFPILNLLDGRTFEQFQLDVGVGDPVLNGPEIITGPPILEFAGINPPRVPCYPLPAQLAEKLHAYTRPHAGRDGTRVKDFVDILLIAGFGSLKSSNLFEAFQVTFQSRNTHPIPETFPSPPSNWSGPYRKLRQELKLPWETIDGAAEAAASFLNPVLQSLASATWNPSAWTWKTPSS